MQQKHGMDKDLKNRCMRICERMNDADFIMGRDADFGLLCRDEGADPDAVCNLLYGIFGMSGDELLDAFRSGRAKK